MKKILKKIPLVIGSLLLLLMVAFMVFKVFYKPSHLKQEAWTMDHIEVTLPEGDLKNEESDLDVMIPEKSRDELWVDHINASDRVNVLLIGTDGQRADTLIFISYSKKEKKLQMISVPRDTYNQVPGMTALGQDKINAVYCFPNGNGGPDNQARAVEKILGVPIHYYVRVNYNGLQAIVDTIGGVEIDVHRDMDYDDPYAEPPLHIHLDAGRQVLKGQDAMGYVRWRKNNDGSGDSDLQRTQRQQEFIIEVIKKSFGLNITKVIGITFDYVRTDMTKEDVLYYGTDMLGFDLNKIEKYMVPGEADYRFFYHDPEATKALLQEIYGFE